MYCRKCGNKIEEDMRFCPICGKGNILTNNLGLKHNNLLSLISLYIFVPVGVYFINELINISKNNISVRGIASFFLYLFCIIPISISWILAAKELSNYYSRKKLISTFFLIMDWIIYILGSSPLFLICIFSFRFLGNLGILVGFIIFILLMYFIIKPRSR